MRIAAAQARPVWLDPVATTSKVTAWLETASRDGVDLIAFPETFLSGYPFWLEFTNGSAFGDPVQKKAYAAYLDAGIEAGGPEIAQITEAARDLDIFVYVGTTERGSGPARGTIYCSLFAIDPRKGVVGRHRKLVPTYEEKLIWGYGDGYGLRTHQVGHARVGGLNCWENWMPQARHALYADGEDIHVSVWPGNPNNTVDLARFIAIEGRVWSLAACGLLAIDDVPPDFPLRPALEETGITAIRRGGSAIAAPDGSWVVEPVLDEERIIVADIDLDMVRAERLALDSTGHSSRPDVFRVTVDRSRLDAAEFAG
ncbi:carbon-nitrogen hydrolase family protein [Kribbella capetownensis]|uniref:Carbon-nitrogen hydrolase family protein n=1 Tax=Kribbella capetownensis TaxID=1572659 RepID=A0A4R0IXP4_9ACTN|nr:carbon-nitrogen hydrolase family protein [Kribbella capetownensis]TCC37404.1 carbon-nitrogen hydrolase family protein [Kribbella capetownensis]